MDKEDVKKFALSHVPSDYVDVKMQKIWKGYEVWEPIPDEDGLELGWPQLVLVKGDTIRMSTIDEVMEILGLEWD